MQQLRLDAKRTLSIGRAPVSMQDGAQGVAQLLPRWPDTDAVVCVSDHLAFGALAECQRLGWAVPDRLAIAGFGGFAVGSACHAGRRHRTACAAVQPFAPHGAGPARRARQAGKPAESSCATFDKTVR